MVFVGGCAVDLLITDPAGPMARPTRDVDAIVATTTRAQYYGVADRLRGRGFAEDSGGEVICRWHHAETGLQLDLMPTDPTVLGFSNPWYGHAMASGQPHTLEPGTSIRLISAPAFIATKLAAFRDRGRSDWLASHDLEDILVVVDGRDSLVEELALADEAVRDYVAQQLTELLAEPGFVDSLPGLIEEDSRDGIVLGRLEELARPVS